MARTGVHSGLEKHRFHQAEEPRSPDLRKGDQTFVFVCLSIKPGLAWFPLHDKCHDHDTKTKRL